MGEGTMFDVVRWLLSEVGRLCFRDILWVFL